MRDVVGSTDSKVASRPNTLAANALLGTGIAIVIYAVSHLVYQPTEPRLVPDNNRFSSVVDLRKGHKQTWSVNVSNAGAFPIRLLGSQSSCSNFRVDSELPIDVPAGGSKEILVSFVRNPKSIPFYQIAAIREELGGSKEAAMKKKITSEIVFLSDLGGRSELSLVHTEALAPGLIEVIFMQENTIGK